MIHVSNLIKEYLGGTRALRGIDFNIERGEFVVLLGPSGAGKSTILRCINGLIKATEGEVAVNGISVSHNRNNLRELRRSVGMIFQQFNLVKRLSVLENVLCGRLAYSNVFASTLKLFSEEDIAYAMDCLKRVGLADKAGRRADQLSGGQQQRVGIARALVQHPLVILADEPVASLDPRSAEHVLEILLKVCHEDGITVLVSLHNLELARRFGERVLGIKDGILVMDKKAGHLTQTDIELIYDHDLLETFPLILTGQVEFANA